MDEKSLHLHTLENLHSALDHYDTSFIVSNKLFRLALVSEILDTTCLFEQLYCAWCKKLPFGENADADVDFEYWKSYNNWDEFLEKAQQNACIDDADMDLGNGLTTNDIKEKRRKTYSKNLYSAFKHAKYVEGKTVSEFFKNIEKDKYGSITYGNIVFGAIQHLLLILSKINDLLQKPSDDLLLKYSEQQKERFLNECQEAVSNVQRICDGSYSNRRKINLLKEYRDKLKTELSNSKLLELIGNEFTKYDIEDYRSQHGKNSMTDDEIRTELSLNELMDEYNSGKIANINMLLFKNRRLISRTAVCSFFVYAEILPILKKKMNLLDKEQEKNPKLSFDSAIATAIQQNTDAVKENTKALESLSLKPTIQATHYYESGATHEDKSKTLKVMHRETADTPLLQEE